MMDCTVDDLVNALIRHLPRAVIPLADLAEALGITQIGVRRLARRAETDDRAIYWHEAGGVVMSASEAEARGRELRSSATDSEVDPAAWFWVKASAPEGLDFAERFRPDRAIGGDDGNALEGLFTLDSQVDEDDPVIARALAKLARASRITSVRWRDDANDRFALDLARVEGLPTIHPTGLSIPWNPALEVVNNPDCPVCGGRKLGLLWFCLACSRSGLDGKLPTVPTSERPKSKACVPDPSGLAGGVARVKVA